MWCHSLKNFSLFIVFFAALYVPIAGAFVTFESGQVRPLAMSQDGNRLFAVNTPDNQLEVFDIKVDGLVHVASVPVGLEPVAVAVKNNTEVWVVNHLSDSISIIDLSLSPPRVKVTLMVGDEPRDIVFAGNSGDKAFISTAHRGQNSPYSPDLMPFDAGEVARERTSGTDVGRADVWVFDAASHSLITILTHFTDTPRALAVSPNGSTVYVAGFHTGNQTTAINEGAICDGWDSPVFSTCFFGAEGGLPLPKTNFVNVQAPDTGLIVKYDGTAWVDELNRDWSNQVKFNLPDRDVFAIDATSDIPFEKSNFSGKGVGTILYNMITNPVSGLIYVSNTEAINEVRFEGTRENTSHSSVIGHQHETRITILDPSVGIATPLHLNKHINYDLVPSLPTVKENSLAIPMGMAISSNGATLYVAAFGSSKIGLFNTSELDDDSFVPNSANHITVTGGGPSGMVLDEVRNKLYVLTRFDNSISSIDTISKVETSHLALHNPEPANVVAGRRFLYDANLTSSNGEAACGSCHVFGDFDSLAWDLGDPEGSVINNQNLPGPVGGLSDYHPMKGPMATQSLRGMKGQGPLHWRGDRSAANSGGDPMDSAGGFKEFNVAFVGLLGRDIELSPAEMDAFTSFIMEITYPPNPNRPLDNGKTPSQQRGADIFMNDATLLGALTCNACHVIDPPAGLFGSSGLMSTEMETQDFKIPHLRNMYQKVGMFGMPLNDSIVPGEDIHRGDQVRGFGFLHDGSVDTLFRFHGTPVFSFLTGDAGRTDLEQFMHAMDTNLKPIVGQQVTSANPTSNTKVDLMIQQSSQGNSDLIVKANVVGEQRGWVHLASGGFQSDKNSEGVISETQLRSASVGQMTFTSVPLGSGFRMGIDRDEDGVFDADDNCPANANTTQVDGDGDAIGDACDVCITHGNADQRDSNGDGYGNRCDGDFDNNGFVNAIDLGRFRQKFGTTDADGDINGDGFVNAIDLGMFRQMFGIQAGPSALHL